MVDSLVERQVENAAQYLFKDNAGRVMKVVNKMAAKQGGKTTLENYQLLGKRAIAVAGVVIVVVQTTASIVGFVMSRRSEQQRIERVVRRMLEEERQKAEAEAKAEAKAEA